MRRLACAGAALVGTLLGARAYAEALYVIDQLVVSVSSASDESGERIASIRSGESVQLLERHDGYSHVRLASGTEGWVKSSYLSPEPPLQQKLSAQAQEIAGLKEELARLREAPSTAARTAAVAPDPPAEPRAAPATERPAAARPVWAWIFGPSIVALVAGFALGWRMLDRRIRRKYGGLRIY
jgi:hypothetical protein